MKATMNENGVITLTAETVSEVWALEKWSRLAWVIQDDITRREQGYWRGSKLVVDTGKPKSEAA